MFISCERGKEHPTQSGWILLGSYNPIEVHIVCGLLKTSGIECFIEGEAVADVLGLTVGPMGEKLLFVRLQDYEDAIRLVEGDKSDNT